MNETTSLKELAGLFIRLGLTAFGGSWFVLSPAGKQISKSGSAVSTVRGPGGVP